LATGLSVHAALRALKRDAQVVVCFSAGNLGKLAKTGFVVADNDESGTGQRVAERTGLPYFLPPKTGWDFNDFWKEVGTFRASQELRRALKI
jgi:putative DNA primase/helicase